MTPSGRAIVPAETVINTVDLIKQNGGNAIFVQTDVGDAQAVENLVKEAVAEFGRLDMSVAENTPSPFLTSSCHALSSSE